MIVPDIAGIKYILSEITGNLCGLTDRTETIKTQTHYIFILRC